MGNTSIYHFQRTGPSLSLVRRL